MDVVKADTVMKRAAARGQLSAQEEKALRMRYGVGAQPGADLDTILGDLAPEAVDEVLAIEVGALHHCGVGAVSDAALGRLATALYGPGARVGDGGAVDEALRVQIEGHDDAVKRHREGAHRRRDK